MNEEDKDNRSIVFYIYYVEGHLLGWMLKWGYNNILLRCEP